MAKISQVTGGGLNGLYNFAQFHFHWGSGHTVGSEHTVSKESYPMEVWRQFLTKQLLLGCVISVEFTQPSEDVLYLKYVSFKLHLVHFNRKYGDDLGGAIEKGNGAQDTLAVLGIMFRMTEADNKKLQPLIEGTK